MDSFGSLPRSPLLMSAEDSALLIVDVQERLLPAVRAGGRVIWNCRRLLDGAQLLGVPAAATEQYPKGLGPTAPELRARVAPPAEKLTFSCGSCVALFESFRAQNRHKILVAGIEAHVCVQQTVLDLLADGWAVFIAADAVSSRFEHDERFALRRMEAAGAIITTTEAALFEWCRAAGTDLFKQISRLARESCPEA